MLFIVWKQSNIGREEYLKMLHHTTEIRFTICIDRTTESVEGTHSPVGEGLAPSEYSVKRELCGKA